ncbi:MAG: DUF2254 domain-containing protein [Gemmatimonadetes bacterium]|nr:DUF2254 domain-containing protein [Gemmatimonadota bacterium]
MKRTFLEVWDRLRGSYWLVPGAMALGAVVLAGAAIWSDLTWAEGLLADRMPWLVYNHPEGARALLTSIAGSMITVAGVTFSITIVAVAYVSSQLGPRVLDAFMRDRGNQATLGTFIATFIYCLLVLRTVRSPEEDGVGFVPEMAVLVAFFMALASVGVLIYFINHVLLSIHASHVIAAIGHDLEAKMEAIFPEPLDHHAGDDDDDEEAVRVPAALKEEGVALRARDAGYVTHIGQEDLVKLARDRDLVVEILVRPGAFVRVGTELLRVHPAGNADEKAKEEILEAVHVGRRRTQTQDVLFLVNELAERHLAYPVLFYFHSIERHTAIGPSIAVLDETLTVLDCCAPGVQMKSSSVVPVRAAITEFLDTLYKAFIAAAETPLPRPDVPGLRDLGIPMIEDDEVDEALEGLDGRRRLLRAMVEHDAWDWDEISRGAWTEGWAMELRDRARS